MHAVLDPIPAHEFQHLKDLLEVQILLIGHHIKHLYKIIGLLPVAGSCQIPCGIDSAAIGLEYQTGRHVPLGKIHDGSAVVYPADAFLPQLVDNGLHLVFIKSFPSPAVKVDIQPLISLGDFLNGGIFHTLPEMYRFRIPGFDLVEPGPGFIVHFRMGLCLFMIADIKIHQFPDGILFHRFGAPLFISHDHLAELSAPVPQMVDAYRCIAQMPINAIQGITDGCSRQMMEGKRFGNING